MLSTEDSKYNDLISRHWISDIDKIEKSEFNYTYC